MKKILQYEFKRNATIPTLLVCIVFIILAIIIVQIGIEKFKREETRHGEFSDVEFKKISRYINYPQYGIYGFRMKLKPVPFSALFFNSTPFDELLGHIDNGVRIDNYEPKSSPSIFRKSTGGFIDFSWIMGVLLCLTISVWGIFSFRNEQYIKKLENYNPQKIVRLGIIFTRSIIIFLFILLEGVIVFIQYLLNGITLGLSEIKGLIICLFLLFLLLVFFLSTSSFFGKIQKLWIASIVTGIFWIFLVFILPEIFNIVFTFKTNTQKSEYKHELNKTELLMMFEKEAYLASKRYNTKEEKLNSDKNYLSRYLENELPKLIKIENSRIKKTENQIKEMNKLNSFTPITFFQSTINEISSKGYRSYLYFYKKNSALQVDFFIFYSNHVYKDNYGMVIPFLKKGENFIISQVEIPYYFLMGLLILILYITVSFFLSLVNINILSYKSYLPEEVDTDLNKCKLNYFLTKDNTLKRGILKYFINYWYLPNSSAFGFSVDWRTLFNEALDSGKAIIIGTGFLEGLKKTDILFIKEELMNKNITLLEIGENEHQYYRYADKKLKWCNDSTIDHAGYSDYFDSDFKIIRPTNL